MKTVLVTGATGNLGKAIVWSLRQKEIGVKAATRNPGLIQPVPGVHFTKFAFEDTGSIRAALHETGNIVLIAPSLEIDAPALLNPVIDLAAEREISHIVLVSALGVNAGGDTPLRRVELHLTASGVPYTIVRPMFFMENFTTGYMAQSISNGSVVLPAGGGKTSYISVADVADVIAAALNSNLVGKEFDLTGPAPLHPDEVAAILSNSLGRTVVYTPVAEEDIAKMYESLGMPESIKQYVSLLHMAFRYGWADIVTGDVETVLGRPPFPFEAFARVNVEKWK